jgi:UDP-N-acetyl-D-galactosamine dehydrogenase
MDDERYAVVGLGYVGLPLTLALAETGADVLGYDIDVARVEALRAGVDHSEETSSQDITATSARFTSNPDDLAGRTFFIVTVPTPIDENHQPNLSALIDASQTIGARLEPGALVVYESTVYPGVTEEVCGPALAASSGLTSGEDFSLAYSPERINPGDSVHGVKNVMKVVGAQDPATLERVVACYERFVSAGVHRAPSIQVAEAAKVIENTQRDVNIALMNEFALILDRLGISTQEVLEAASTKWNFLSFEPGLVGGHCIGIDPYYLTARAQRSGYHPDVILASRRINDGMAGFVAERVIRMLIEGGVRVAQARVGVLGLAFKPGVSDLRNSGALKIIAELDAYGVSCISHDPCVDRDVAREALGCPAVDWDALEDLDALILAVPHPELLEHPTAAFVAKLREGGLLVDVSARLDQAAVPASVRYWCL